MTARVLPPRSPHTRNWKVAFIQSGLVVLTLALLGLLASLTQANLAERNINTGFGFLDDRAGFAIGETLIAYAPAASFGRAILVGLLNTMLVSGVAILLSTLLGFAIGMARLSGNWLLSRAAGGYVEVIRNLPLLLQLFVCYALFLFMLPRVEDAPALGGISLSNRGLMLPALTAPGSMMAGFLLGLAAGIAGWIGLRRLCPARRSSGGFAAIAVMPVVFVAVAGLPQVELAARGRYNLEGGLTLSTELLTLIVSLTLYTAAYIGEIVRGGLAAVPAGQSEAATALGLNAWQRFRHVVLPQSLKVILPPMTSWHLNTVKNSSLGVAIGYPEIVSVIDTMVSQTGQAIEGVLLIVMTFLTLSLAIAALTAAWARRHGWSVGPSATAGKAFGNAEPIDLGSPMRLGRWARRTLFATPGQALVSALVLGIAGIALWRLADWVLFDAVWSGTPADCRAAGGACWLFLRENHRLILFGTYPQDQQWRAILVVCLFAVGLVAGSSRRFWHPALLPALLALPVAGFLLMRGGFGGLAYVPVEKWSGLPVTLLLAATAVAGAFPLAVALALGRRSQLPVIRYLATGFIELVRGVPLIGVLFMAAVMFPLFMPAWLDIDSFVRVQIALILFTAAYMAEAIRGGLIAVPKGQTEAAEALGLSRWQATRRIVLPQALKVSLPGIVSTAISEVKNTTLVLIVGIFDLLQTTRLSYVEIAWRPYFAEAYLFSGAIFFALCFQLSRISQRVERHLHRGGR